MQPAKIEPAIALFTKLGTSDRGSDCRVSLRADRRRPCVFGASEVWVWQSGCWFTEVSSLAWSCPLVAEPPIILSMLAEPLQKNTTSKASPMKLKVMASRAEPFQLMLTPKV